MCILFGRLSGVGRMVVAGADGNCLFKTAGRYGGSANRVMSTKLPQRYVWLVLKHELF